MPVKITARTTSPDLMEQQRKAAHICDLAVDFLDDWDQCNKDGGTQDDIERAADARDDLAEIRPLLTAAPDLLAALERMLEAHDADVEAGSMIAAGNGQAAAQARAAIARRKD